MKRGNIDFDCEGYFFLSNEEVLLRGYFRTEGRANPSPWILNGMEGLVVVSETNFSRIIEPQEKMALQLEVTPFPEQRNFQGEDGIELSLDYYKAEISGRSDRKVIRFPKPHRQRPS